jgi:hypothetical protein
MDRIIFISIRCYGIECALEMVQNRIYCNIQNAPRNLT